MAKKNEKFTVAEYYGTYRSTRRRQPTSKHNGGATVTVDRELLQELLNEYKEATDYWGEGCWGRDEDMVKRVEDAMLEARQGKEVV